MWLGWGAILFALMSAGVLLVRYSGRPARRGQSGNDLDPLLMELEREERVAREHFEHRYASHPQCFCAEGQIRSE